MLPLLESIGLETVSALAPQARHLNLNRLVALKMLETGTNGNVGLAYTGSVIEHIGIVRESLVRVLGQSAPRVHVMAGAVDALEGALWRARGGGPHRWAFVRPPARLDLSRPRRRIRVHLAPSGPVLHAKVDFGDAPARLLAALGPERRFVARRRTG